MINKLEEHYTLRDIFSKLNELVDAVNELTDPCQDPKAYKIMKEKDEIIARHIQEKNDLQRKLDIAVDAMKKSNEIVYSAYGSPLKTLKDAIEQIESITKGGKDE